MTIIDDVYRAVPSVECRGHCQHACGVIACSAAEADAMRDNGINPPSVRAHPAHGPMSCSHLTDGGRCGIYAHRPLVCRLYGAVKEMRCPYGCRPIGGFLPDDRARQLFATLNGMSDRPPHLAIDDRMMDGDLLPGA